MVLFHLCIPFAVEHCRPRETIKTVIHHWVSFVGWTLGLSQFLLGYDNVANNNNQRHLQNRQMVQVEYRPVINPQRVVVPDVDSTSLDNDYEIDGIERNLQVMEPNE